MAYVITELCIRDGSCAQVCPVECIVDGKEENGWNTYYIDPDTCIDCGACAPECPVDAIFPEDEVPEEHQDSIARNRAFFEEGPGYG
jgi:ferredoxin